MQLRPREYFTIARGIEDHQDNAAYYVRAVVRNGRTDALIETVDLTNQGDNHRYSYPWQVPADPQGEGFYIIITTSVYTDSGYTSKSELYGDKYDTYLVQERMNPLLGMGGGGADVDYKKVRKIVEEVVSGAVQSLPKPEKVDISPTDLSEVMQGIVSLGQSIQNIRIPEQEKVDFSQILSKLDEVIRVCSEKEFLNDHLEKLGEVIEQMKQTLSEREDGLSSVGDRMDDLMANIRKFFAKDVDSILEGVNGLEKTLKSLPYVAVYKNGKAEEQETL